MIEAQSLIVRRRILDKSLHSWREVTRASLDLRQKYFLMMIFNRWKYYTDECIELRQMRYVALIHWAAVRCKKSFGALKLHAKQNRDALNVTSFLHDNRGRRSTRFTSSIHRSRSKHVHHVCSPPDSMKFTSATAVDSLGYSYDATARKDSVHFSSAGRKELRPNNMRALSHKPEATPSIMRRSMPPHNLYRHDLGPDHGRIPRSATNATTSFYSGGRPSESPIVPMSLSTERHASSVNGILQSPSHFLDLTKTMHSLTSTQPRHPHTSQCFGQRGIAVPSRRPGPKSISDFIISNLLDEIISKVERRNIGYVINCSWDNNNRIN